MDGNGRGRVVPLLDDARSRALEDAEQEAVEQFPLTETGNAERFVARSGAVSRFVPEWMRWLVWTGQRWEQDASEVLLQGLIKDSHRQLYQLAARCPDDKAREQLVKWARVSERRNSREATAKLARSETGIAISHHRLDANPLLLNVANGTIDLKTGKLQPPRLEDLITRLVPVSYDRSAP